MHFGGCMYAHLTSIHMYTYAHVLLVDVISVKSLMDQQEVTVVCADRQIADYPLRLSHPYCCTSCEFGERKLLLFIFTPL